MCFAPNPCHLSSDESYCSLVPGSHEHQSKPSGFRDPAIESFESGSGFSFLCRATIGVSIKRLALPGHEKCGFMSRPARISVAQREERGQRPGRAQVPHTLARQQAHQDVVRG